MNFIKKLIICAVAIGAIALAGCSTNTPYNDGYDRDYNNGYGTGVDGNGNAVDGGVGF